ncbi:MAG: c-type cytochrome domain-containing protein [Verrucomicrobiota bacterium]
MMKTRLLLLAFFGFLSSTFAVDYMEDVRPILSKTCFKCHGGPRAKKGIHMDKPESFQEHVGPGKYIVPGDPTGSELVQLISLPEGDPDRMPPPRRGEPLSDSQIRIIKTWIQEGAHFEKPDETEADAMVEADTSEGALDLTKLYTWTSAKGTTLEAYFVAVKEDKVALRSTTGQTKVFPISVFAPESQEMINSLAAQQ